MAQLKAVEPDETAELGCCKPQQTGFEGSLIGDEASIRHGQSGDQVTRPPSYAPDRERGHETLLAGEGTCSKTVVARRQHRQDGRAHLPQDIIEIATASLAATSFYCRAERSDSQLE